MTDNIIPLERIQREAREAALRYSHLDDACPYPFGSAAGAAFRDAFCAARAALDVATQEAP